MSLWNGSGMPKRKALNATNTTKKIFIIEDIPIYEDGDKIEPVLDEKGQVLEYKHTGAFLGQNKKQTLDHEEDIQENINSQYEDTKISTIIQKFQVTGDPTLFNQHQALDPKIANKLALLPKDPNDTEAHIKTIQQESGLGTLTKEQLEQAKKDGLENMSKEELIAYIQASNVKPQEPKPAEPKPAEPKKEENK